MEDLKEKIFNIIKETQAITPEQLMQKSGAESQNLMFEKVNELLDEGRLVIDRRGNLTEAEAAGMKCAVMTSFAGGFGFARPKEGEDIYVHCSNMRDALPGDKVLLRVWYNGGKGYEGEVVNVLEYSDHLETGRVVRENGKFVFEPHRAYRNNIPIAAAEKKKFIGGEKIRVQIIRTNGKKSLKTPLLANVVSIYGDSDSAKVCSDAIIDEAGIPVEFSPEAIAQAKFVSFSEADTAGRLDLRNEPIFTIDGADAKDLDDAISVKKTVAGWQLGVHIADVSHYVTAKSPLDINAYERGTSVYFADRVIPMYPEALSNGVCSLNGGEDKLAFSAIIDLDNGGNIVGYQFRKTVINSKVRGVYSEVNDILDSTADEKIRKKYEPVMGQIELSRELYEILKSNAEKRGVLRLESNEIQFELDENGVCSAIYPRSRGIAEEIIEQFMITANVAAARFAKERNLPFVYRIHEEPNADKLSELTAFSAELGLKTSVLSGNITNEKLDSLLKQAEEKNCSLIVSDKILRAMAKAKYAPDPIGHFGLSLADYTHFTSPIRRYPDSLIHRILSDAVAGVPAEKLTKRYGNFVAEASAQSSACELRAMQAERDAEDCYMAEFMRGKVGEEFKGFVRNIMPYGIYVLLENGAEGFIPVESLDGQFDFDGKLTARNALTGEKIKVGDRVDVVVTKADVSNGQIDLKLLKTDLK